MGHVEGSAVYMVMLNWFAELDLDGADRQYDNYGREFRCLCLAQKRGVEFYELWEKTEYQKCMMGLRDYWNFFFFNEMVK